MQTLLEIGLGNAVVAAALALFAAAVSRLVRRPALGHALWLLVLLKLVTPPLFPLSLPWPSGDSKPTVADPPALESAEPIELPQVSVEEVPDLMPVMEDRTPPLVEETEEIVPPTKREWSWSQWAGFTWLAGAGLWFAWTGLHLVRSRRLLRYARPAPTTLQNEAETLARKLGMKRSPVVRLVPGALSPMVWGFGPGRCILFPAGLLEQLDAEGRRQSAGSLTGSCPSARPLGAAAGTDGHRAVLVASRPVVGPARTARSGRIVL